MKELWEKNMNDKEVLIMGDLNVDWNRANDPDYFNKNVARKIIDFTLEEDIQQ